MRCFLLVLQFFLGAIGTDDAGVVQMELQVASDGIDVDPAQLVTLHQLFFGQALCFVFAASSLILAMTAFISINVTSHYI